MEQVFARVPRNKIFEKTGIQFQPFNTLYQLFAEGENLDRAAKLVLMPDLVGFCLTGSTVCEYTNATTTQMVIAASGNWDLDLLENLCLTSGLLPEIVPAGTDLGKLKPEIADELGLSAVRVIAPATHDTASAVAAAPLLENWAYISSGTWSLIGIERNEVLINSEVEWQNFTNEGGVYGTYRFLKNVMGLWIFESCRREWRANGIDVEYDAILAEIDKIRNFAAFIRTINVF
jgi:rhamnulokinase